MDVGQHIVVLLKFQTQLLCNLGIFCRSAFFIFDCFHRRCNGLYFLSHGPGIDIHAAKFIQDSTPDSVLRIGFQADVLIRVKLVYCIDQAQRSGTDKFAKQHTGRQAPCEP